MPIGGQETISPAVKENVIKRTFERVKTQGQRIAEKLRTRRREINDDPGTPNIDEAAEGALQGLAMPEKVSVDRVETSDKRGLDAYKTKPFDIEKFRLKIEEIGLGKPEDLVNRSATSENLVGSGGNGSVFSIPGMEGYVLRVPNVRTDMDTSIVVLESVEDKFSELNLGQAVAKLGICKILKEQKGIPAGVPYGEIRRSGGREAEQIYSYALEAAASMPQSAYDNLAELFAFLNKQRLSFDPSKANNLLIDQDAQRFNVVDLNPTPEGRDPNNNFSYMVIAQMDNAYSHRVDDLRLEPKLVAFRKTILLKAFEAAIKAKLPIPELDDSSLEYSFTLSGMDGQWPAYREQLKT